MPLTAKGSKILKAMEAQYGAKKGEAVFYASRNKGTISGVDSAACASKLDAITGMCDKYDEKQAIGKIAAACDSYERTDDPIPTTPAIEKFIEKTNAEVGMTTNVK